MQYNLAQGNQGVVIVGEETGLITKHTNMAVRCEDIGITPKSTEIFRLKDKDITFSLGDVIEDSPEHKLFIIPDEDKIIKRKAPIIKEGPETFLKFLAERLKLSSNQNRNYLLEKYIDSLEEEKKQKVIGNPFVKTAISKHKGVSSVKLKDINKKLLLLWCMKIYNEGGEKTHQEEEIEEEEIIEEYSPIQCVQYNMKNYIDGVFRKNKLIFISKSMRFTGEEMISIGGNAKLYNLFLDEILIMMMEILARFIPEEKEELTPKVFTNELMEFITFFLVYVENSINNNWGLFLEYEDIDSKKPEEKQKKITCFETDFVIEENKKKIEKIATQKTRKPVKVTDIVHDGSEKIKKMNKEYIDTFSKIKDIYCNRLSKIWE